MVLALNPENFMLPCFNKQVLGIECMGCGLQRSVVLLFQGEFIQAFYMYPAIYPLLFLSTVIIAKFFYKFKHAERLITILAIATISVIILNYLYKLIN